MRSSVDSTAWSPDSTRIAFIAFEDDGAGHVTPGILYILDLTTGRQEKILTRAYPPLFWVR